MSLHGRRAPGVLAAIALLAAAGVSAAESTAAETSPASWPRRQEVLRPYDVVHYKIELALDVPVKRLAGDTTVTLVSLAEAARSITLDADTFTVTAARDGAGRQLAFEQRDGELVIHLAEPVGYGDEVALSVSYDAVEPRVDAESNGLPPDYRLGLSFRDATDDSPEVVSTLSWPTGAHHWFPCNDRPADRATQELIVTVPSGWSALSNGALVSVAEDAEQVQRTFHWRLELSHPTYLAALVAGPYVVLREGGEGVPIGYWVYRDDEEAARGAFEETPEILEFFSRLYRFPYPWPKYDQAMVPGITGGAESTSATLIGERRLRMAQSDDYPMGWLVAHEAAHQWWGNVVTHRDWAHTWLSESFATYGEHNYLVHHLGPDEGAVDLIAKRNVYLDEARTRYRRPIVFDRWRNPNDVFDRHSYQKGALVLHMLRDLVGDDAFFAALSSFLQRHAFQSVDTHDFEMAVREATGTNLDWFFDQWLRRPGHPVLEVGAEWDEAAGRLTLTVAQVQDTSDGTPVFRLPVGLSFTTATRSWSESVWLSEPEQSFIFDCPERPLMVRLDPRDVLLVELSFPKSSAALRYQLQHDDVAGRIWAAAELTRHGEEPEAVDALRVAARSDPFWAVRRQAVLSLGSLERPELASFFEEIDGDSSSRVRTAAVGALGALRVPSCLPYLERRFGLEPSVLAKVATVHAAVHCGGPAAARLLDAAAATDSPGDAIRRAADEARTVMDGLPEAVIPRE